MNPGLEDSFLSITLYPNPAGSKLLQHSPPSKAAAAHFLFLFFFFINFLATPHGMRDLSSPTRDRTCAPAEEVLEAQGLNHWTTREVPLLIFY